MGSYQVLDSSCSSSSINIRRGLSKSQMFLHKILQIIASYPPQETSSSSLDHQILECKENRGRLHGIDLNMEFCPWPPEVAESQCLSASSNVSMAEKSSEGECDPKDGTDSSIIIDKESRSVEVSQATNLEAQDFKEQENLDVTAPAIQEQEKGKKSDCFSLLVEAAEVVSGMVEDTKEEKEKNPSEEKESEDGDGDGGRSSTKRSSKCWVVDMYTDSKDIPPVVRSKRGRNQVLPSRYRDSVLLGPWKRLPPPRRPGAASTVSTRGGKLNNEKQINSES